MSDPQPGPLHFFDPNPTGSPLVFLIHALGVDLESWAFQFPALLDAGMRPLAADIPGFGRSPLPAGARWTLPWVAAQLAGLVEQTGQKPVYVVGLSLGGVVAQQFALDYPDRVSKLVLANTFSRLRPRRWNNLAYLAGRFVTANLRGVQSQAEMVAWRIFPDPGQSFLREMLVEKIHRADPRAYRAAMRALAFFNNGRRLQELHIPTLVISGERDNTVPLETQRELAADIPGAKQVIIPDAGHGIIFDQPERFNRALLAFLKGTDTAA